MELLEGIKFNFIFKPSKDKDDIYLRVNFGVIPREKLNLKDNNRVKVSYDSINPYIIKIEKKIEKKQLGWKVVGSLYHALTNSHGGSCLRLRLRWKVTMPPKHLFKGPYFAKYEIHKDSITVYLKPAFNP